MLVWPQLPGFWGPRLCSAPHSKLRHFWRRPLSYLLQSNEFYMKKYYHIPNSKSLHCADDGFMIHYLTKIFNFTLIFQTGRKFSPYYTFSLILKVLLWFFRSDRGSFWDGPELSRLFQGRAKIWVRLMLGLLYYVTASRIHSYAKNISFRVLSKFWRRKIRWNIQQHRKKEKQ